MSTRYVWERYNITDVGEFENRNISEESTLISTVGSYPIIIKANVYNETPTINSDGTINYPAATIVTMQLRNTGDTDNALSEYAGKYFTLQDNVLNFGVKESDNQVHIATNETRIYSGYAPGLNNASVHFVGFETYKTKIVDGPGTLQGYSSSNSAGAYPQDGISGSYWYDYQGSDNIDPSGVSIPSSIKGGQAITISVTPGSGKVYGGTVSYAYEVQLNGGSWQSIATTTATSQSYTVPKGTDTVRVRVHAMDNIGFTSTTYVQSNQVAVQNSNVHVGVNGVVRNAETVVCVGGVIRSADCYACVNGVIRSC